MSAVLELVSLTGVLIGALAAGASISSLTLPLKGISSSSSTLGAATLFALGAEFAALLAVLSMFTPDGLKYCPKRSTSYGCPSTLASNIS